MKIKNILLIFLLLSFTSYAYVVDSEPQSDKIQIRYSAWENSFPMLFRNKNHELDGYLVDVVALLQSRTLLSFQYVESKESPLQALQNGEIDMLPLVIRGVNTPDWMYVSEPYLTIKYINVTFKGAPINRSGTRGILFSENNSYEFVRENIFDSNSKSYTDLDKLIHDLKQGAIQSAYIREDMLNYVLVRPDEARFIILASNEKKIEFSVGVDQAREDLKLYVDEILNNISEDDVLRLKNSYAPIKVTYGYDKTQVSYLFIGILSVIFLLGIIFFLWYRNLKLVLTLKKKEIQRSKNELLFLQCVVDALPNLVCIHDSNHRLLLSNYAFRDGNLGLNLLYQGGFTEQEVCSREDLDEVLLQCHSTRREISIEVEEGRTIVLDCYRTTIASITRNTEKYVLTVINDITEFKNQQQELLLANETAQCAVASRERFLASISHELRTPIAGMLGLLEMLKMCVTDEDAHIMLNNITASARHLHLLVNDILDFSKLEAQQFELDIRECFFLKEVGELLRIHCSAAREKMLEFDVHWTPTDIQIIKIDSLRLAQIINNILSNAIKFTSVGRVTVNVAITEQEIEFLFSDTGEGMSPELLDTVFDPFVQADSTIARRYGGTGLGLAIVHDLLKVMGGEINIDSVVGEGTTIRVIIPHQIVRRYSAQLDDVTVCYSGENHVVQQWLSIWGGKAPHCSCSAESECVSIWDESLPDALSSPSDLHVVLRKNLPVFRTRDGQCIEISSAPFFADLLYDILVNAHEEVTGELVVSPELKGLILVAEDNPINQLVMRRQLTSFGLDVEVVDNGREAYERIKTNPDCYDLLITDCHMPHLDGYELANKLRETIPEFADKAIIGCTAEDSRITAKRALESGFDEILYKPYRLSRLHALMEKYLPVELSSATESWWDSYDLTDAVMLVEVYIDTMSADLQLLQLAQDDQKQLHQIAHRIKGGAGAVGEQGVYQYAQELEIKTSGEDVDYTEQLTRLVNRLDKTITAAREWLTKQD